MSSGEAGGFLPHHLLDDGVATLLDLNLFGIVEDGFAIVPIAGEGRPSGEEIDFRKGFGSAPQGDGVFEDFPDELAEEEFFAGEAAFLGVEDFLFFLFQLLGIEALRIDHCLLADVILGNERQVGFGNFNEITEGSIVFDFKVSYAGALLFLGFQVRQPALAIP